MSRIPSSQPSPAIDSAAGSSNLTADRGFLGEVQLPMTLPPWCENLQIDDFGDEILIFEPAHQLAFRLEGPTAMVFRSCGVGREVADLVSELGSLWRCDGGALLLAALEELQRRGLLQVSSSGLWHATRRSVLTSLTRSAVVLPSLLSVAMPSAAAAMSSSVAWLPSSPRSEVPEGLSTEKYDPIRENAFRDTLLHPVSTFSVDVDTASYSNVRRFLESDQLPPRDAVRTEEMINYFSYDYPEPTGSDPIAVWSAVAQCPWKSGHQLLQIGLKARSLTGAPPTRNLVFLIDASGSMSSSDKLPLLKASFRKLIDQLNGDDRVAIVAYAGASGLVLPATPGSDKETILEALDNLQAGGSTNGGSGIKLAYSVARSNFLEGGVNRVLLATDGDFNVGISSRGELLRLIEKEGKGGVYLTILGLGRGNLNDAGMEELSNHGDGHYAYIDTLAEANKVLVDQAGSTLVTVAKDVKVQIEFNPLKVAAYRLIGYENRLLDREDFLDDDRDAGDVGAGHSVTALYQLIPESGEEPPEERPVEPLRYRQKPALSARAEGSEIGHLRLRHKPPEGGASRETMWPILAEEVAAMAAASDDQRLAASVAAFAMLLRESSHRGSFDWQQAIDLAESAIGDDLHGYRRPLPGLMRRAARLTGIEVDGGSRWPWRA